MTLTESNSIADIVTGPSQAEDRERQLGRLLQSSFTEIYVFDAVSLNFLQVSEGTIANLGYSAEELSEMTPVDVKPALTREGFEQMIAPLRTGEQQQATFETLNRRRDGSTYPVEVRLQYLDAATPLFLGVNQDISERKQAEAALVESEELYRSLFENMLNGFAYCRMVLDGGKPPDFIYLVVNQAFESQTGLKDVVGRKVSEVLPGIQESDLPLLERYGRVATTGQPETFEIFIEAMQVWFSISVYSPAPECFVAVFDVITERKRSEAALRASEERFRASFEQAALGMAHVSVDGHWLRINQKLCDILGYPHEELLQKSFTDITPPDEPGLDLEELRRLVADEGGTLSAENQCLRRDGSRVWVDLTVTLVRTPSGESDYFLFVTEDITARKQSEAALELQTTALSATADAMIITDAAGAIEWVNPAFTALTGYSAEEVAGKHPQQLVGSGVQDRAFYKSLWDTIRSGKVWQGGLRNRRKDGSLWDEEQTITPVKDAGGEIKHFIAVARDVTERKRLEAQFLQAQKMDSVGQLAGGIAHDFNNLLNVINGTAYLVSEQLTTDDRLRDDLSEITKAGDRAAAMTRQLLAFSRKQIMQPKILDLCTLVRDLEGMLRRLLGEDVDIAVVLAQGPCTVMADPGQIEQVVMNLAVNARDAMPTGGSLTIGAEAVQLDAAPGNAFPPVLPGPYVMLTVSDSGEGMDEATLARIFEPFFTTKEVGQGTGLGLSTVYGIVRQSGGSVSVDSAVGKGTTFKIWFPRADEAAHAHEAAPAPASERGAETVLLVEDYPGLRVLARRMLERAGYTVLVAGSGREALKVLDDHDGSVDLLMTDVVLPGRNGRELAEQVAKTRPGIRVIYTSGYTEDALMRNGIYTDTVHFLGKPYTSAALMAAVRNALAAD